MLPNTKIVVLAYKFHNSILGLGGRRKPMIPSTNIMILVARCSPWSHKMTSLGYRVSKHIEHILKMTCHVRGFPSRQRPFHHSSCTLRLTLETSFQSVSKPPKLLTAAPLSPPDPVFILKIILIYWHARLFGGLTLFWVWPGYRHFKCVCMYRLVLCRHAIYLSILAASTRNQGMKRLGGFRKQARDSGPSWNFLN